jgi:hypothetical protein
MNAVRLLLAVAWFPAIASAQSSPGFTLESPALGAFSGGGSEDGGSTAFVGQPNLGAGEMTSTSFGAAPGFLESNEPQLPDHPVVFGLSPSLGLGQGGTLLEISGAQFDYLGAGPTVLVDIGGLRATGVAVTSNTRLTCMVPPLPPGFHDVTVTSTWGSETVADAWLTTPALVGSQLAIAGTETTITNLGPPGGWYLTIWSTSTTNLVLPNYGTLLVGPAFQVFVPQAFYPDSGADDLVLEVPEDPVLDGLTLHLQTLSVDGGGVGLLTNALSTTISAP